MPTCKKCNIVFPFRVIIDGKIRNLKSRKYCLKCSPFGQHNTSLLEKVKNIEYESNTLICINCGREYILIRGKKVGHTLTTCNSCVQKIRYHALKKRAVNFLGGKCIVCDYKKDMAALEFHHVDPLQKEFGIGSGRNTPWGKLQIELNKCVLLCCRCHREVHSGIIAIGPGPTFSHKDC